MRDLMISARMRQLTDEGWDGYAAKAWATRQVDELLAGFAAAVETAVGMFNDLADAMGVAAANSVSQMAELLRVGWWSVHGGDGLSKAEQARQRRTESLLRLRERRAVRRQRRWSAWQHRHCVA